MSAEPVDDDAQTIGIPFAFEQHGDHCSASLEDVIRLLRHTTTVQRALTEMGVHLSDAQFAEGTFLVFALSRTATGRNPVSTEVQATLAERTPAPLPPSDLIRACLETARMPPSEVSPTSTTRAVAPNDVVTLEMTKVDMEKIRVGIQPGPETVLLSGALTPWSPVPAKPMGRKRRTVPMPLTLEPVCSEIHLISSNSRRYHPEDARDASAVTPGSTVIVESCSTERVLFATKDSLILQGDLDFRDDQAAS